MAKIAIIGTGIAGMSAAFFLKKEGHDIVVYEQNDYIGGHTHTVSVKSEGKDIPIDTGFIVYNENTYLCLLKLFEHLDVPYDATDMSFAVSEPENNFEFCGSTLNTMFCQRSHILSPSFYKLIYQIMKFNKIAPEVLTESKYQKMSIEEYFRVRGLGKLCFEKYLVPMSIALWSAPFSEIKDFPILSLVRFFHNHGLLGFNTQFQWRTVKGGSWQYRDRLIKSFRDSIKVNSQVSAVERKNGKVHVTVSGEIKVFDKVVLASHADQSLRILKTPTELEKELLSKFSYQENRVDLHTDDSLMPQRKLGWAAWNHKMIQGSSYVTYWMNKLQSLNTSENFFVSLNSEKVIEKNKIVRTFNYHHPIFKGPALEAQLRLPELNERDGDIFFCGSYFGHGFHEDAARSSFEMCKILLQKSELL